MSRTATRFSVEDLVSEIAARLPRELGGRFDVVSGDAERIAGYGPDGGVDFVIHDRQTGKSVLVEVKGSSPADDLPLSTIPFMRRKKELNAPYEMVVLSYSHVPSLVERSLADAEIQVVKLEPEKDVVPELAAVIERAVR